MVVQYLDYQFNLVYILLLKTINIFINYIKCQQLV